MRWLVVVMLLAGGCMPRTKVQSEPKVTVDAEFLATLKAEIKAAMVDASREQTQHGNGNRISDTDPWTTGIAVGGVVAVVAIVYGVGRVQGDRCRRKKALKAV